MRCVVADMARIYARWAFVASFLGLVLSLIIRSKVDGVAFLFCVFAVASVIVNILLTDKSYMAGLDDIQRSIDRDREHSKENNNDAA